MRVVPRGYSMTSSTGMLPRVALEYGQTWWACSTSLRPVSPSTVSGSSTRRVTASANSPGVDGATPVTVRGGQGFFVAGTVAVRLPSGRWLTVSGARPESELIAVANCVQLDPAPDYRWLGRATS